MKALIHQSIDRIYPALGIKARRLILERCEEIQIQRGEQFVEKGKDNHYEYFLLEGLVRSYLLNQEGEAITLLFFDALTVLSPHVTRTRDSISLFTLESLSECRLARIDARKFEQLIETDLEIREFANTVLRQELFHKINKEIRLVSWTGKQRLEQFRKDFHMLENRVPHSMIASYLGITHVSLSRLRKNA